MKLNNTRLARISGRWKEASQTSFHSSLKTLKTTLQLIINLYIIVLFVIFLQRYSTYCKIFNYNCTGNSHLHMPCIYRETGVLYRYALCLPGSCAVGVKLTRNSSGDEIANVNFLCDDIVHALKIQ